MPQRHPLQLARLREIGWAHWDPAGIPDAGDPSAGHPAADEYDEYLVAVADGLRQGWDAGRATAYLVAVEAEDMRMGVGPTTRERAEATVDAIGACLRTLDEDRGPCGNGFIEHPYAPGSKDETERMDALSGQ